MEFGSPFSSKKEYVPPTACNVSCFQIITRNQILTYENFVIAVATINIETEIAGFKRSFPFQPNSVSVGIRIKTVIFDRNRLEILVFWKLLNFCAEIGAVKTKPKLNKTRIAMLFFILPRTDCQRI